MQFHFKAESGNEAGNYLTGVNHIGTNLERVSVFDSVLYKSDIKAKSQCPSDVLGRDITAYCQSANMIIRQHDNAFILVFIILDHILQLDIQATELNVFNCNFDGKMIGKTNLPEDK